MKDFDEPRWMSSGEWQVKFPEKEWSQWTFSSYKDEPGLALIMARPVGSSPPKPPSRVEIEAARAVQMQRFVAEFNEPPERYEFAMQLLRAKADAVKAAGLDAYHVGGWRFLYRGMSQEDLQQKLDAARSIFRNRGRR
jgi:hypothetical protein